MHNKLEVDLIYTKEPIDYAIGLKMMEEKLHDVINKRARSAIWLLEHEHVYTGGARAENNEILGKVEIPIYNVDRGGKYTYHGPGQRIVYLIIDLKALYGDKPDIRLFVESLSQATIKTLNEILDLHTQTHPKFTGIWTYNGDSNSMDKIAAIGMKVKKWVTYHGIAININPDLSFFKKIIPCGVDEEGYGVTSCSKLKPELSINKRDFDALLLKNIEILLGLSILH